MRGIFLENLSFAGREESSKTAHPIPVPPPYLEGELGFLETRPRRSGRRHCHRFVQGIPGSALHFTAGAIHRRPKGESEDVEYSK
jgi:hypothetical protein